MSTLRSRFVAIGATAIAASLVLAGCAASDEETTTAGGTTDTGDATVAGCEAYAAYAGNEGAEVRSTPPLLTQKHHSSSSRSLSSKSAPASPLTGTVLKSLRLRLLFALRVELHLT